MVGALETPYHLIVVDEYKLEHGLLQIKLFDGRHTSENISKMLKEILSNYKVEERQITAYVTDGGANVRRVFYDSSDDREQIIESENVDPCTPRRSARKKKINKN
ncbi:hypothetical protein SNEBB_000427 [Seison nebaliae]|nr:hypothetical protein SNEBB_000427 [Seison nebaliae]